MALIDSVVIRCIGFDSCSVFISALEQYQLLLILYILYYSSFY